MPTRDKTDGEAPLKCSCYFFGIRASEIGECRCQFFGMSVSTLRKEGSVEGKTEPAHTLYERAKT